MSDVTSKSKWSAFLTLLGLIQAPITVLITQLMIGFGTSTSIVLSVTSIVAACFIVLSHYIQSSQNVTALSLQLGKVTAEKLERDQTIKALKEAGCDPIKDVGDL